MERSHLLYGKTQIILSKNAQSLGQLAAKDVARTMRALARKQATVRMVLAGGESQNTFLNALAAQPGLPWDRTLCFNMDEFWDPRMDRRYTCEYQIRQQLYNHVNPSQVHWIDCNAPDPEFEAKRYATLLQANLPIDIVCEGIGTSGHLALNEPGQTDFKDDQLVRVVEVSDQSKRQLIDDPNFREQGRIPDRGITMTIPALMRARHIFTMVPLSLKRPIVTQLLQTNQVTAQLPASILRQVSSRLYLDNESAPLFLSKG